MSQNNNKELEMAVGTSNMLESNIMEGENFYTPMETATEPESATQSQWTGVKNDTGQLCRVCANSSDYAIPIYEGEGLEHQLELKIQKHLPIQVSITDVLPLQLCYTCASTLIGYDSMLSNCLEAEKKLKALHEAAEEASKSNEDYDDSHLDTAPAADSDDEPLIQSKTKLLSEKSKATPIKKKILSKAKTRSVTLKTDKTATNSKEGEDKERARAPKAKRRKSEVDEKLLREVLDIPRKAKKRSRIELPKNIKIIKLDESEIRQILREDSDNFICHFCAKEFKKSHLLQAHIRRVHEKVVVAKCDVCNREFRDTSNYASHIKIHSGVKSYVCHHCGKSFAQLQGLKIHQRMHTGNYPEMCTVCGRRFRTKQHLSEHASSHTDERPFQCPDCKKLFRTRLQLKSHSWIHSDKFRYYCQYCPKGFNNSSHRKLHVMNHHVGKVEKIEKDEGIDDNLEVFPDEIGKVEREEEVISYICN